MKRCDLCKKIIYNNNVLCKKCLDELKQQALIETKEEFKKQCKLDEKDQSQIFKHAKWEILHNSCYDDITEEEFMQEVYKLFEEIFCDKLVGCKLYTIKTGEPRHPNERIYDLYKLF